MMYVDLCFLKVERGFNDIEGEGRGYCIRSPEVGISLIGILWTLMESSNSYIQLVKCLIFFSTSISVMQAKVACVRSNNYCKF